MHLQAGIFDAVHELRVETMRLSGRYESVPAHVQLKRPGFEPPAAAEPVRVSSSDVRAKVAAAKAAARNR